MPGRVGLRCGHTACIGGPGRGGECVNAGASLLLARTTLHYSKVVQVERIFLGILRSVLVTARGVESQGFKEREQPLSQRRLQKPQEPVGYELPGGSTASIGHASFQCPELLFQ